MAAVMPGLSDWPRPLSILRDVLREELAPYPGREMLVARMVIAAVVMMLVDLTFRIPDAAYGAIYTLAMSRESTWATVMVAKNSILVLVLATAFVIVGAMFSLDDPVLRMLWLIITLFMAFFAISVIRDYTTATGLAILIALTIPLWDQHIPVELKVTGALWAAGQTIIAGLVTSLVALAFEGLGYGDNLLLFICQRLTGIESLLNCYAEGRPVEGRIAKQITRLAVLGTSTLRSNLQRSGYSPHYVEQMGAVAALAGRVVDIAAGLADLSIRLSAESRERVRLLMENIAGIRADLRDGGIPRLRKSVRETNALPELPMLYEMERTVSLIAGVFVGSQSLGAYSPPISSGDPPRRLLVHDALSNPNHIKFGLKGCLAASLCYIIYTSLNWPGISTAVTTCLLTALTTIGASRQKQVLRFSGVLAGGAIGIASQVFILPQFDSIFGFTLLFVAVTVLAAWITASGPRISYFGLQFAVAFYFINLGEFKIQTSLVPARDRVVGVLLGLFMMWLVFDQLWGASAAVEMRRTFISSLRSLAQFAREPISKNLQIAIHQSYSLRETINQGFNTVRAFADGVLFEFGPSRQQDLAWRSQIVRWQPQLRICFLTRVTLLKYRLQLPGFKLPERVHTAQREFDEHFAATLDGMADRLEGKARQRLHGLETSLAGLETAMMTCQPVEPQGVAVDSRTFLLLSRRITGLAMALDKEILATVEVPAMSQ
jgi:multidrug resistance protein MdtO